LLGPKLISFCSLPAISNLLASAGFSARRFSTGSTWQVRLLRRSAAAQRVVLIAANVLVAPARRAGAAA